MKGISKKIINLLLELIFLISLTMLGRFNSIDFLLAEYQIVVTIFWVSGLLVFMNSKKSIFTEICDMTKDFLVAIIMVPLWYLISGDVGEDLFEIWNVVIHFAIFVCIVLFARMFLKSIGKVAYISQMLIPIATIVLIKLRLESVWAVVIAVLFSHLINYCGYINKTNPNTYIFKTTFRECRDDYLAGRKKRYTDIALEVQKVIIRSEYEESEASFELAKKWMLNNERLSLITSLVEAGREILKYISDWIPVIVSFALGILTAKLSNNFGFIQNKDFWAWFMVIIVIGFPIDLAIKNLCNRIEKSYVIILKDMKYVEYAFLIKNQEKKENADEDIQN